MASVIAEERRQQIAHNAITKPITENQDTVTKSTAETVTKPVSVTKVDAVTKPKNGRPLIGDKPMTAAERMRQNRAHKRAMGELDHHRPQ